MKRILWLHLAFLFPLYISSFFVTLAWGFVSGFDTAPYLLVAFIGIVYAFGFGLQYWLLAAVPITLLAFKFAHRKWALVAATIVSLAIYEVGTQSIAETTGARPSNLGTILGLSIDGIQFALAIPIQAAFIYLLQRPEQDKR